MIGNCPSCHGVRTLRPCAKCAGKGVLEDQPLYGCPRCHGKGACLDFQGWTNVLTPLMQETTCSLCEGVGLVDAARQAKVVEGQFIKAQRRKLGRNRAEEAKKRGITVEALDRLEAGED